jgi:murein DD-endopeptidase MepM/ murein hydrolase activator NlpD
VRRLALFLSLTALFLTAAVPVVANEDGPDGGLQAVQTGYSASGGVRYATLAPKPKGKPVKEKTTKKERKQAKRKAKRRKPKPKAMPKPKPPPPPVPAGDHAFPIRGAFSFGGKDSRFGSGRPGHIHQGQDMSAALGTPIVAPTAGTIEVVRYQAGGAGYYIVLDGDGEDRDYVFMHLRKGSTLVKVGDAVAKGQPLAEVGSTGSSSGPHLHFEIWIDGGWYTGGQPVDPLPFLQAWL